MQGSVAIEHTLNDHLRHLVSHVRSEGRTILLEHEAQSIVRLLGIEVPDQLFIRAEENPITAAEQAWNSLWGDRVVVKVVSPEIVHKSDLGGVRIVPKRPRDIADAIEQMRSRLAGFDIRGFLVSEFVQYDASPGGEILLGVRWTRDFGPVVSFGPGGVAAELLAKSLQPGKEIAILSPDLTPLERIHALIQNKAITPLVTGVRKQIPRMSMDSLTDLLIRFVELAAESLPDPIEELEINPLVLTSSGPIALDVLIRIGEKEEPPPVKPIHKIHNLLHPRSVAVVGVSKAINPGRIIVKNLLREGFDPGDVVIVKPDCDEIDGCRCVPDIASIPGSVDLIVLSIAAEQVPDAIRAVIEEKKAESVIVIPGGIGERAGSESIEQEIRATIRESRATEWGGPVINGGNSLGIRSIPGNYDTMFLPEHKVAPAIRPGANVALISQSGAFAVSKASKLERISPRYLISIGNQIDLTVGDYMTFLADDPSIDVFAFYVEGFQPGDGRHWLEAASRAIDKGKAVILYRAGRTPDGARATASHTAAIAGDAVVTRELARGAGVIVASTLEDFEDLIRVFWLLGPRNLTGIRIGAISNAGYECVAMADNAGPFRFVHLSDTTIQRAQKLLRDNHLDRIMNVGNPFDVNPLMGDTAFVDAARAILADPGIDIGIVGCVPLTGALETLPPDQDHEEDLYSTTSVVGGLIELWSESTKPWVAVVDAGRLYDAMVDRLTLNGIPTFRTADRAMRILAIWADWKLRRG